MRRFLRMTNLPEELERGMVFTTTDALRTFVRQHTTISNAGDHYGLVQVAAKEIRKSAIAKFLTTAPDYVRTGPLFPDSSEEDPEDAQKSTPVSANNQPRVKGVVKVQIGVPGAQHPQPLINAKNEEAKAVGGSIQYSRGDRGWKVTKPDGSTVVWTSDFFRDTPVESIRSLLTQP